ncbi:MAG: PSD1 and planctomycete cytochrome C domain-containing protein [Verrucomicrobiota bacterium]
MKLLPLLTIAMAFASIGCDSKSTAASGAEANAKDLPKVVTFNAHIRPIFSNTCFACHGFDAKTREADLRLDTPEGAYAKLKDSNEFAIVPGKPDESAVLKRIFSNDAEDVMPPKDFHKDLTDSQKALVRTWIEQGAKYEQHWAFAPVVRPELSKTAENPIDTFIGESLASNGIKPSPRADKATLLRRLSLDLTGLPPTLAELDAFLSDNSTDAWKNQVDRLLASSAYGERMAVPWLDVVRFADTVGYHGDQNLRVFPYRDYVIRAFNDNMPFDRFTIEQLAGDLLPDATDDQKIATGFLRLNLMTREGGAQPGEYLAKSTGDRVRAVGAAWLGLTTGCAECHDHKFDPLTTRDFYSLGAFFADVRQWGVYAEYEYTPNPELRGVNNDWPFPPEIVAKNATLENRLETLRSKAVPIIASSDVVSSSWSDAVTSFLADHPTGWQPLAPAEVTSSQGTHHEIRPDASVVFSGPPIKDEILTLSIKLPEIAVRAIRFEALADETNHGKVGRQANGKFTVTPTYAITTADSAKPLEIAWRQAARRTPHAYRNGTEDPLLEPEWRSAPGIWEEPTDAASLPHHAIYHLAETLHPVPGSTLEITLASSDIGRVRFSITPFGDAVPGQQNALRGTTHAAFLKPESTRSEEDRREISAAWKLATTPDGQLPKDYQNLRHSIIACRAGYAHSVVSQPVPVEKIPKSHILPRGNWMAPAEEVQPAVPDFLPHASLPTDGKRLTRLDLARWLTADENPLTARQFTNRLWKQFFGKGLSNVLDDLGNQGEWPSHPELLDWLAAEFRDSGWDVKQLVRLIVTSRTYQQQSASRNDLAEIDPDNRLLAQQSARRLDAEFIRDNALAVAGLLRNDLIGGPSVKPYQPAGYFANLNFPQRDYDTSHGDDQFRRGLYMHWQRSFTHPMLAGFDAPSREECSADRFQSNSPQQALTLLNDPSFVEAARGFAIRLMRENPDASDAEKISQAIRLALSRESKATELDSLTSFLKTQRSFYQENPADAAASLKIGQSDPGRGLDTAELAAWSQLCRVILNLHESITRY